MKNLSRRSALLGAAAASAIVSAVAPAVAKPLDVVPVFDYHPESNEPFLYPIIDWVTDLELDTEDFPKEVHLTREAFKYAKKNNLIDYIPDADDDQKTNAILLGMKVKVPGTRLA